MSYQIDMNAVARSELELALAERIVEGMDMDTLVQYAIESLTRAYEDLTMPDLLEEVENFAPDLLESE